ncbi:hypothetical protein SCOR_25530 [Sulfidibacter corallicola]
MKLRSLENVLIAGAITVVVGLTILALYAYMKGS